MARLQVVRVGTDGTVAIWRSEMSPTLSIKPGHRSSFNIRALNRLGVLILVLISVVRLTLILIAEPLGPPRESLR